MRVSSSCVRVKILPPKGHPAAPKASVSVLLKYGLAFEIRKSTPLIAAAL